MPRRICAKACGLIALAVVAAGCADSPPPESQPTGASMTPVEPVAPQPERAPSEATAESGLPEAQGEQQPLGADPPSQDDAADGPGDDDRADEADVEPDRAPAPRARPTPQDPSPEECERARIRSHTETVCDDQGNCFSRPLPPGCR